MRPAFLVLAMSLLLMLAGPAHAVDASTPSMEAGCEASDEASKRWWEHDGLTGNWGGLRDALALRGADVRVVYTGDTLAVVAGGLRRRTAYLDNTDMTLTLDAEKLVGWTGARFFVYGLGDHGRDPSAALVGDMAGVDNIEAPDTFKLYEAWYLQELFEGRFSILGGLYNLNGEFDVDESAQTFINSAFGIGTDYSQSGLNGPSIFPVTSLAVRIRVRPTDHWYVQTAVLDGAPGSLRDDGGTQIAWQGRDGVLVAAESGCVLGQEEGAAVAYGKYAFGGWAYSTRLPRIAPDSSRERSGSHGLYALAEQQVYREATDAAQGLSLFARVGYADPTFNNIEWMLSEGGTYTGLVPGRDADLFGVAATTAWSGRDARDAGRAVGEPVLGAETVIEMTYCVQLTPWLTLQPDLQYIVNPGLSSTIGDALVVGVRFTTTL
jgi:porin